MTAAEAPPEPASAPAVAQAPVPVRSDDGSLQIGSLQESTQ